MNGSAPSLSTPAICFRWGQMDTRDKSNGFRKCHRMHRIPQQGYKKKKKVERIRNKFLCREIPQQDRASVLISKIERAKEGKSVGPNEGTGHKPES